MPDRDLQEGANDISYEWQMAAEMAGRLHELVTGTDDEDPVLRNAYLEAGLVHYRCLVNFLCGDKGGKWHRGDMQPRDFLGRKWWPPDQELDHRLRGRLAGINQCLQHLSWERVNHTIIWPFGLLAHEVHYAMGLFLEEVPAEATWRTVLDSAQQLAVGSLPPKEEWRATAPPPVPARR